MKRPSKRNQKISLILVVLLFLAILNNFNFLPVAATARDWLRPVARTFTDAGQSINGYLSYASQLNTLAQDNEQIKNENVELKNQLADYVLLQQQNEQLRDQLGLSNRALYKFAGAEVIGYIPNGNQFFLQINRGQDDGVKVGDPVLGSGLLIGVVQQVGSRTAIITPSTDPAFRALAVDLVTKTPGLVNGGAENGLVMDRIPAEQKIEPGNLVVTSGLDGQFPQGLIIGEVDQVSQEDIFQRAEIKMLVDLERLLVVEVMLR
jgi:rod shape-determining protein MreC